MNKTLLAASLLATSLTCAANPTKITTGNPIQYVISVEECRSELEAKVGNCTILGSTLIVNANNTAKVNSRTNIKRIIGSTEDNAIREDITTVITTKSIGFDGDNKATVAQVSVEISSRQDDMNSSIRNSTPLNANYAVAIPKATKESTKTQNVIQLTSRYWLRIKPIKTSA